MQRYVEAQRNVASRYNVTLRLGTTQQPCSRPAKQELAHAEINELWNSNKQGIAGQFVTKAASKKQKCCKQ